MAGVQAQTTYHMDVSNWLNFMDKSKDLGSAEGEKLQNFLADVSDFIFVNCPGHDAESIEAKLENSMSDPTTMRINEIFGEIEAHKKQDLVIKVLDFSVNNGFGRWERTELPTDFSQDNLLDNVKKHFDSQGGIKLYSDIEQGHCYGLSSLWAYHMLTNGVEDFYKDLELIANGEISEVSQDRRNEIENLVGQMIFLQSFPDSNGVTQDFDKLKLISDREEIKGCNESFNFVAPFSPNESGEYASLSAFFEERLDSGEEKYIEITQSSKTTSHACGVYSDGESYYFYDPNNSKKPEKALSVDLLTKDIVKNLNKKNEPFLTLSFKEFCKSEGPAENKDEKRQILERILNLNSSKLSLANPIFSAAYKGDLEMLQLLFEKEAEPLKINSSSETMILPIEVAVQKGHIDIVKFLFEKGGPLEDEMGLLFGAANFERKEVVECLKDFGVHPDMPMKNGLTPLQWAVREDKYEMIGKLLKVGADPRSSFTGMGISSPIFTAVENGSMKLIKLFDGHGINLLSTRDDKGWSLLHTAAGYGQRKMVHYLLEKGADPYEMTENGETALAIASKYGFNKIHSDMLMS
ncbi:MAG: ankyrin repeat protein [Chlamydiales bacterium]|jgi:ankyrin repeat protein